MEELSETNNNLALTYIKDVALASIQAKLAEVVQGVDILAQVSIDAAENIEMLNDLTPQTQADSMQPILCADAGNLTYKQYFRLFG